MTAQLYQRNLPSSGTPWKEEHCGINRYSHIITSLVFTGNSVKYVVSEGVCVCVCVSSSRTAPPLLSSRHVPPWTWSWISRPAGRVRGSWWRSWAHWGSWSCDWRNRRPGRTRSSPTGPWGTSASAACSERPRDRLDWKHSTEVTVQTTWQWASASSSRWLFLVLLCYRPAKASRSNVRRRRQRGGWGRLPKRFCRWGGRARRSPCRCRRSGWDCTDSWSAVTLLLHCVCITFSSFNFPFPSESPSNNQTKVSSFQNQTIYPAAVPNTFVVI